jgi:hypothetical protein
MSTESCKKVASVFSCLKCAYSTSRKSSYDKHILTAKCKNQQFSTESCKKVAKYSEDTFDCICGKQYTDRSGLWRHKNKNNCHKNICDKNTITNYEANIKNENKNDEPTDKELILMLIKQNTELVKDNSEFKNMMIKVLENGTNNTTNNTINTNSHNKAFNLNFFLNETCKDAMNIMDFVESIQLQLSDLERVGEVGYIEGISNIIVKNLKALDVTQRPVHCTDKKRETLYVKDDNKWEKDDENIKMHKMIRKVQDKNFRMIKKFKEKYPDYHKPSSKQSDVYNNIIIESMGGRGDNDYEKEEKIIKKVSKEIVVEK